MRQKLIDSLDIVVRTLAKARLALRYKYSRIFDIPGIEKTTARTNKPPPNGHVQSSSASLKAFPLVIISPSRTSYHGKLTSSNWSCAMYVHTTARWSWRL